MAQGSPLCGILTFEECELLPDHTKFKLEEYVKKSCQQKAPLTNWNTQSDHHGLDLDKQIEELKQHLLQDTASFSKFTKSRKTLTQIFSQYNHISEQLLLKEEECQEMKLSYDQLLKENAENLKDADKIFADLEKVSEEARLAKMNTELARNQLRIDREARANSRFQIEKELLESQVNFLQRELEVARTGCKMPEEEDLGLEPIQHLATLKSVEEALQKHQTLWAREEFDAAVKSGVAKEKFAMEQTLESYREEIDEIKECRKLLKEMGMDLECLQAERDAYLRVIREEGLKVPVMVDGSKVDFADASPPSESSPTQKRDRLARALYDDWKRSRLQEEEEVLQTEEVHEEDEGWLPMREDVNETQDESEMDEDPPAAVPFECSPVTSNCRWSS